jgi:hypothetical protein
MNDIETTHQHCLAMFDKLSQFIDNELDAITHEQIERHVKTCLSCYICLETLKRTVAVCRQSTIKPPTQTLTRALKELVRNIR